MTESVERLYIIRNHLRSGVVGQREAWEEWLAEAAADIDRLQVRLYEVDVQLTAEGHIHARECMALRAEKNSEIERLTALVEGACNIFCQLDAPHWAAEFRRALESKNAP